MPDHDFDLRVPEDSSFDDTILDSPTVSAWKKDSTLSGKFSYALQGISFALVTERNLRIHMVVAVLSIIACLILRVQLWGWVAILTLIALVIFAELFNTAIETVVDLISPEYHILAKRAKDVAAGAVLVLAMISVLCGLAIYIDAFLSLIGMR
ncbi:MAG: diacylglycerol kinase family protein [Actinobacteria bacterium]|nr:diacylglycerol kinase family protein [Actinomycetota bacterium]